MKQDYKKASAVCDAAGTPDLVRACYVGLGRNASGASAFQYAGIRKRYDQASPAGVPFCYEGAVRHLAYAPSELPRGVAFCKSLPEGREPVALLGRRGVASRRILFGLGVAPAGVSVGHNT